MIETLLFIAWVSLLGAMTPWPDFIVVMKNTLTRWRLHGFMTALWISTAILVHSAIVIVGLWAILASSVVLFQAVKIWWACYLLYLAYQLRVSQWSSDTNDILNDSTWVHSYSNSYLSGFIANIANPKFVVFLLSLFAQLFTADTSLLMYLLSGWVIASAAMIRFGGLAYLMWNWLIKKKLYQYQTVIHKVFGALLMGLWIKILIE